MKAQSLVDLCKKALSIDSSTNTGTTDFVSHIESLSEGLGLFFKKRNYLFRDLDYQNILISASSDPQDVQLLFVNPLDTESPGSFRSWTETDMDPFFITIKEGQMFGLGANSGKLNTILLLKALSESSVSQRGKVAILGTYGREVRSYGAIKFLKEKGLNPQEVIIGFPTNNEVVTSQAGRFRMRINLPFTSKEKELRSLHDEKEHSSSESQYFHSKIKNRKEFEKDKNSFWKTNAIGAALSFFENLPERLLVLDFSGGKDLYSDPRSCLIEFDLVSGQDLQMGLKIKNFCRILRELIEKFSQHTNSEVLPNQPMIHLGRVVCDFEGVEFWGECIFPAGITEEIYTPWVKQLRTEIENLGGHSKMISQRWPYVFSGEDAFLSKSVQCASFQKTKSIPYTSEADLFCMSGLHSLIYGPGKFSQMFAPNESIRIADLEKAFEFYKRMIVQMA